MSMIGIIEKLLVNHLNSTLDRRDARRKSPTVAEIPDSDNVVGHVIWPTPAPVSLSGSRMLHQAVFGSSGSGKSTLLRSLIRSDIRRRQPLICIDLQGDFNDTLLPIIARESDPKTLADRLFLMDLASKGDLIVPYNPLQSSCPEDATSRALHALSTIRRLSDGWGVTIDETLRNTFCALSEANACLTDTEPFLTNAAVRSNTLSQCTDSSVHSYFERYNMMSTDRQLVLASSCLNKLTPLLAARQLRSFFGSHVSTYSFRKLIDETPGLILLASLGIDRYQDAAQMVFGMLASTIQQCFMDRIDIPESDRRPVHLYIDEAQRFDADRLELLLTNGRRFGCGVTCSSQHYAALEPRLKAAIRANCFTHIYFANSHQEAGEMVLEFNSDEPKDVLKNMLVRQTVGQCFVVRRSEPTIQMKVRRNPDAVVPASQVDAIRQASLRRFGRPRAEIEADMADRKCANSSPKRAMMNSPDSMPNLIRLMEVKRGKGRRPGQYRPDDTGSE